MKTLYFVFLVLLISYSALFAQDEAGKSDQKIQSVSAVNQTSATTAVASYDFTTSASKYYGGAESAAILEINGADTTWGMIAGDANADGQIDADDRAATWNSRNDVGYLADDVSLDGQVDADDRATTWNNRNRVTSVPN